MSAVATLPAGDRTTEKTMLISRRCGSCQLPFCDTPVSEAKRLHCPFCGARLPRRRQVATS